MNLRARRFVAQAGAGILACGDAAIDGVQSAVMRAPALTSVSATRRRGLVRAIGLGSAILFVVGSVIGSGIFLTTGGMAALIPSASLLLLAWALGGVLAIAGGLTYAEMGAMFPRSGGVYVFLREAYGAAARVPLRLGVAARRDQRRHRRRGGGVCRVPELFRPGRSRRSNILLGRAVAVGHVHDLGRPARRRPRRSRSSARSTTSAFAPATW